MPNSLLVVEGVHDAAFFGLLLKERGFREVVDVNGVPAIWDRLIPRNFPKNDRLDHVVHYPDIYVLPDADRSSVAILVGRSLSSILDEVIDATSIILPSDQLDRIGLCIDADNNLDDAQKITNDIFTKLDEWLTSSKLVSSSLELPPAMGSFSSGDLQLGAFIFPNNADNGALETLLMQLADYSYPTISAYAGRFVEEINLDSAIAAKDLKKFRKGGSRNKTHVSFVSNVLRPGSSLAVAIEQCSWVPDQHHDALSEVRNFVLRLTSDRAPPSGVTRR